MYSRILKKMRDCVRQRRYIMTAHAEEEMCHDELSVYDVERVILTGAILERQADRSTGELKYRVRGNTMREEAAEVVSKLGPTGKLVIMTVSISP